MTTFETFKQLSPYAQGQMTQVTPRCFNGEVSIRKYRITIELVDEPKEVLAERLCKLWVESDNHHHFQPLWQEAERLGIQLDRSKFGKERKRS